ncbi:MAG: hypothetical protein KBA61_04270 [Spirochaetes bacterium]|nr:hypothetical protein [Spirochaetota bacterium]
MTRNCLKYCTLALAVTGMMAIPSLSQARKWSVNFNTKNVNPRIMQSFITRSGNASAARSDGTNFQHNDKIHFYYKVGPLASISGKGAPFRTKLVVRQGSRTLKDFGWQSANAANSSQMDKNATLTWYHSAAWNLTLAPNINPGRYSAIVSHQDLNSGKTLNANYSFSVKAASGGSSQGSGGYSIDDFIASAQRRDANRCVSYIDPKNFDDGGSGLKPNDVIRDLRSYITSSPNLNFIKSTPRNLVICAKDMALEFNAQTGKISGGGVIVCGEGGR